MPRATYVMRDGVLTDVREAAPLHSSHGAGPYVISDGMDAIRSMADGRMYDSKHAYYGSVKRAGCEIVGNDSSTRNPTRPQFKPQNVPQDIKRAIAELRSR